jgi:enamine deaminase RidA (YjgF/YER057c/UK114 family)
MAEISKEEKNLGMPWEKDYGYSQAVKVGDTIYVSGQVGHDDQGNILGPAAHDDEGNVIDPGNMEAQMRQAYANAKKVLAQYGATMDNVVDEVLYVTDMDAAFAVAGKVRKEAFSGPPVVASTIVQTPRLAFPAMLIEIKFTARV